MAKVFISYSRKDTDFAKRLTAELQKSELDFWIDWEGIPPTVDWWKEIEKGIEEADVFLFLISPDSARSKICRQEVEVAEKNGKRMIPLLVREVNGSEVPGKLGGLNWIFFRDQDDFAASAQKLSTAIHTDYDWVQAHRRLQVKALEWDRNSRESSFLLRGRDLKDAEAQLTVNGQKPPLPTPLQREFVDTSAEFEKEEIEQEIAKDQQIKLEQRIGARLSQLTYLLIGIFTIAFIALFLWLNAVVRNLALSAVRNQMLAIAETSVSFVNGDAFETLLNTYAEGDPAVMEDEYYLWLARLVDEVVSRNQNIIEFGIYFVTHSGQGNKVRAVYTDYDEFKSLWDVDSDSVMLSGMEATSINATPYTDRFGTWVSACSPIFNSDDTSVGALCVDLEASLVDEVQREATNTLLLAFIAVYPVMLALVIFTTRSLNKQRGQITGKKG